MSMSSALSFSTVKTVDGKQERAKFSSGRLAAAIIAGVAGFFVHKNVFKKSSTNGNK